MYTDITSDIEEERPSGNTGEHLRAKSKCENMCVGKDVMSDHAASVEGTQEDIRTNSVSKAVENHPVKLCQPEIGS